MKILLIDADSVIPNIALMKLATWHKKRGDQVELVKANLPYYPYKKKTPFMARDLFTRHSDKIYCSVVFEGNKDFIIGDDIVFGGTGTDLATTLPKEVEHCEKDYSIYPNNDTSYGFITRGCIRKCSFCKVPQKEGYIHKVADVDDIVKHEKVEFFDNNILSYPRHNEILKELVAKQIKCNFNQGLDIRLVTNKNSKLLSQLNYLGEYFFAFDDWKLKPIIEQKLSLLQWRKPFQFKFFMYVHPDMPLYETVQRIIWAYDHQCLPYIMRDLSCWESNNINFYSDLASYCNQPNLFKKMKFVDFLEKRHKNTKRIANSKKIWMKHTKQGGR